MNQKELKPLKQYLTKQDYYKSCHYILSRGYYNKTFVSQLS
jgi:hypothetical protein